MAFVFEQIPYILFLLSMNTLILTMKNLLPRLPMQLLARSWKILESSLGLRLGKRLIIVRVYLE
jgi:hypothetical protein